MSSLDPITLKHKSGSSCTIYPYGATVTSFQVVSKPTEPKREILFVSSSAKLDGSKAIRGGIPLVFPQFGQPDKSYPQHGFLRRNLWNVVGQTTEDGEDGAVCCEFNLDLKNVVTARGGKWGEDTQYDCVISLMVKLMPNTLTTVLTFENKGEIPFDFQTLFHTYFKVEGSKALDPQLCNVQGLTGYSADDKITGEIYEQNDEPIIIDREVDRIYKNQSKPLLDVVINAGGKNVGLKAKASVGGVETPVSVVVWNPFVEKAKGMSDFTDEQYHDMICVEPGVLHDVPALQKGLSASFEQTITAL